MITTTIRPALAEGAFATFGLRKNLLLAISEAGFREPRPIQAATIPRVLEGRDVMGLAQTGTGKTAAFALPILERLMASRGRNPRALILAPTRELALQIHAEIELLAKYTDIRAITVFGGVDVRPQVRALRARPHIIVACPGRLLDLLGSGDARLDGIEVLVLDEAAHMLDLGFLPDIKRIIARLPSPRQNLLFSATMPREIRTLTDRVLCDPEVIELEHTAPLETIEHALYPVENKCKTALLIHLLRAENFDSAIVFLRTKHRTRRLAQVLDRAGHRAIALQGNMSQGQRQRAMQGFRDGRYDVLVATDIAARGIDVAQVSHVINFDIPNTPDAYTHRIGRTGRAERSGKAYTFVTHEDFPVIKDIERKLGMRIPRIKLRNFDGEGDREVAGRGEFGRRRRGEKKPARWPGASPRLAGRLRASSAAAAVIGGPTSHAKTSGRGLSKRARRRKRMTNQGSSSKSSFGAGIRSGKGIRGATHGSGSRPRSGGQRGSGRR